MALTIPASDWICWTLLGSIFVILTLVICEISDQMTIVARGARIPFALAVSLLCTFALERQMVDMILLPYAALAIAVLAIFLVQRFCPLDRSSPPRAKSKSVSKHDARPERRRTTQTSGDRNRRKE